MAKPKISTCFCWKNLLVVLLLVFIPAYTFSQATNIKFKHLSINEGLSQSSINAITQDEMGFMWFGTQDGLNKYDGYVFQVYKAEVDDSTTISNGYINTFYNDNAGNLWIGTNGGVNIFRHLTNTFVSVNQEYPSLMALKDAPVQLIKAGVDSSLWIATDKAIFRLLKNNVLLKLSIDVLNEEEKQSIQISDVLQIDDEKIWIATKGLGILEYHVKSQKWERILARGSGSFNGINSNNIKVLYKSSKGHIYIGSDFGLNIYNPGNNKYHSFIYNVNDPFSISTNFISKIYEDHLGNIWFGTEGGGLNKFNVNTSSFFSYKKNVNNESSIISNDITSIFQDNSGVLWVGTTVGLSKFDLLKQNFNHFEFDQGSLSSISRNIIWSIRTDGEVIWVGSNEGLNKFNRSRNYNESFTPRIVVNGEIRANAIYALGSKNKDILLVGTEGGVYEFNKRTSKFTPANFLGIRVLDRTYCFLNDSKGRLWIGTKEGLHLYDEQKRSYRKFISTNGLPSNTVRKVIESKNGTIWIGTDDGLCKLIESPGKFSFKVYENEKGNVNSLRNNTILSLAEDGSNFIWIGTFGGGLSRLDPQSNQILNYTEKDGLPNNVIYGILIDEKDNLWCSTNNGLSRFNAENKTVRNFDEYDGLQSNEFNTGSYYKDESGELFFGGIKGINSFFASHIQINKLPPRLVITDFQLFNQSVHVGEESVLKKSVSVTDEIILS